MVYLNREAKLLFLHPSKTGGMTVKHTLEGQYPNENVARVPRMVLDALQGKLFQRLYFHYDAEAVAKWLPDANEACFTFVSVRNPYDRAYSLHVYVCDQMDVYGVRIFWAILFLVVAFIGVALVLPLWAAILLWAFLLIVIMYLCAKGNAAQLIFFGTLPFDQAVKHLSGLSVSHSSIFGTQTQHIRGLRIDRVLREETFETQFKDLLEERGLDSRVITTNVNCIHRDEKRIDGIPHQYLRHYSPASIATINSIYAEDFKQFGYPML